MSINAKDKIFSCDGGNKNYIVFYTISYDEPYYADDVSELFCKNFKYEYTEGVTTSTEKVIELVKKKIQAAPCSFFKGKKNVKLHSIEEVYVQTIHERELV